MPPFDENGNMIGMEEFNVFDKDGKLIQLSAATILMCAPETEEHDFLPPMEFPPEFVCQLSAKASKQLIRMMEELEKERERLKKKIFRIIRRNFRLQERIRRERLKGASMDRLWDIELRRRSLAGELTKIYRRFGTWE